MKKVTGEIKRRSHRIGINLTSIKKAAKMKRTRSRFAYIYALKLNKKYQEKNAQEGEAREVGSVGEEGSEIPEEDKANDGNTDHRDLQYY